MTTRTDHDYDPTPTGTRRLGTGQTPEELKVEECLRDLTEWSGREIRYSPVTGGLQNSNWRIDVAGESIAYFLKVPGEGTDEFIDRDNSHVAAMRAGELGISPRIVRFYPDTGIEIVEFLEGYRACTNGDLKRWQTTESVLRLHKAFQQIEKLPVTKTIFDLTDEHLEQVREMGVQVPPFTSTLLREYSAAKAAFYASGLDIVPCHNDPMPGNFLIAPGKPMQLVDFEFASNNERSYELAVAVTEFFYDEQTTLQCVEEMYGSARWDAVARLHVVSAVGDLKWGLWGCVNQTLNTAWDFDYYKYGAWKLARARTKIADPRWGQWLHAL